MREPTTGGLLLVVPDKALYDVSFSTLRNPRDGRFLVEGHPISVLPSALALFASLDFQSNKPSAVPLNATLVGAPAFDTMAFAQLPPLPGSAAEIRDIARLYPHPTELVGKAATRARLLAEIDRQPVLHYSGHAILNPQRPEYSHLVLAADPSSDGRDLLYAHELDALHLRRLRLVVLSACNTIGVEDSRTAGLSGLARWFLNAGASAVLGTLWEVDDQTARRLTGEFHRTFLANGDAADALRQAQRAMIGDAVPPSRWGAFQLVGVLRWKQAQVP